MKENFFTKQSQELLDTFFEEVDSDKLSEVLSLHEKCHGKVSGTIEVNFFRAIAPNQCPSLIKDAHWTPIKSYNFSDAAHTKDHLSRLLLVTLSPL